MKQNFSIAGPFGELQGVIHECEIPERRRNVLVMAHGFRGSMEGGGRAAQLAEEISEKICTVVRFNFTWCTMFWILFVKPCSRKNCFCWVAASAVQPASLQPSEKRKSKRVAQF